MRPSNRKVNKWRKNKPMVHRSYAEKRNRLDKQVKEEIRNSKGGKYELKWVI